LALPQGIAKKRVMPIVPCRFHEDAAQVRIAGLRDAAADLIWKDPVKRERFFSIVR
jgi:hypothetical protein